MTQGQNNTNHSIELPAAVHRFGYAVVDPGLRLRESSPSFRSLVGQWQDGAPLSDVLPVFAGMEATLMSIRQAESPYWHLQAVAHSAGSERTQRYLDILTLPNWSGDGLIVIVRDVTAEKTIAGRAIQQRNVAQLRARKGGRTNMVGGNNTSAENEELDEKIDVLIKSVIGDCLRCLGQSTTPVDVQAAQRVLAASLEIDQAMTALRSERQTPQRLPVMTPQDMVALAEDVVSAHQPWAATQAVEIDVRMEDAPTVVADGALLRSALALMLVDSIYRNSPDDRIVVDVGTDHQGILIKLCGRSTEPSVIAEQSNFETDRLAPDRDDAPIVARVMQTALYLVHDIAYLHHGRFRTEVYPGGEFTLALWLPTARDVTQSTNREVKTP